MKGRWRLVGGLAALALVVAGLPAGAAVAPASPACVVRTQAPAVGLTLTGTSPVAGHPRVRHLTFRSAAMQGTVHADIVVPVGYDPRQHRRYPVLYLLHGHGGNEQDWVNHGADAVLAAQPWIIVTPEGGYDGWYSDWYGADLDGHTGSPAPAWESFHIRELIPWVDAHYRTIAARSGRAIAGLSMGGFGAMSYAARHPDMFVAAASFSGAVDLDEAYPAGPLASGLAANLPDRREPDSCIWGDGITQDVIWRDHDPTELVANLRTVDLAIASGNGQPGPYDHATRPDPGADATELGVRTENDTFDRALTAAGVSHTTWFYGNGTHSWPYWVSDLRHWAPQLTAALRGARTPPAIPFDAVRFDAVRFDAVPFDYETAAPRYSVFGWQLSAQRDVTELTYLTGVGRDGLVVRGSGRLEVRTAPLYRPGGRYTITGAGAGPTTVMAGKDRRLAFTVDLGPSHEVQQLAFTPAAVATWTVDDVRITPAGR